MLKHGASVVITKQLKQALFYCAVRMNCTEEWTEHVVVCDVCELSQPVLYGWS